MYSIKKCDILVIGGGGAGVTAAVLAERSGSSVALVSKEPMGRGDTCIASGIMTDGSVNPSDNPRKFIRDLVVCGEYLNDPVLVDLLVSRSMEATEVLEEFGMVFRRNQEGRLIPIPFPLGGHSVERSLVALSEGNQIGSALRGALYSSDVSIYEEYLITDLFTEDNRVTSALGIDLHSGEFVVFQAKAVILASGGCGWLYAPYTSNVKSNTGDGFALAFEAGAELRDMEHAQFTFGISNPYGMTGVLLGEPASAGMFGKLLDGKGNHVIQQPGKKTRGQVAAAMAKTIKNKKTGPFGGVFLDLSDNVQQMGPDYRKALALSRKSALEAANIAYGKKEANCEAPWEVVPTFHYLPGGVKVNEKCQSEIRNLYAIGQVQGGLFGADRLGSVSLTELFLFAKISAESAVEDSRQHAHVSVDPKIYEKKVGEKAHLRGTSGQIRPIELKRRLQTVMWENVGFLRDKESLEQALKQFDILEQDMKNVRVPSYQHYNTDWIDLLELDSMILLSRIIARSALERKESRGGHVRIDYPEKDDAGFLKTIIAQKEEEDIAISMDSMAHVWEGIKPPGFIEKIQPAIQDFAIRSLPGSIVKKILKKKLKDFTQET